MTKTTITIEIENGSARVRAGINDRVVTNDGCHDDYEFIDKIAGEVREQLEAGV